MAQRPRNGPKNAFSADLPAPSSRRGGFARAWFWAFVSCAALGCAAFWFTRQPDEQNGLRNLAAEKVNHLLRQTPFAGLGDILRDSPPLPPIQGENLRGLPGSLAGTHVRGGIGKPPEDGNDARITYFTESYVPPAREDQKIRATHVSDLANWLVGRYRPQPGGGRLDVSLRTLNAHASAGLSSSGSRAGVLRYAFNPAMISGLYHLYIDRFMADLNVAARTRGLSAQENRGFHLALAGQAAILAQALEAMAVKGAPEMGRLESMGRKAADLHAQLGSAIGELENMQKSNAPKKQQETVRMRIEGLNARYQRSLEDLEAEKRNLAGSLRGAGSQGLDDDSLLYLAGWVSRRAAASGDGLEAIKSAAGVLRDLAHRCAESGG